MCRGKTVCTELGTDPHEWDAFCPLRLPEIYQDTIDIFVKAINSLIVGNREGCLWALRQIDGRSITNWYVEHGQMSGLHRKRVLNQPALTSAALDMRDPVRSPAKLQQIVFERDGYRCRYCGNRLISQVFLRKFVRFLDSPEFIRGATNVQSHAVFHIAWPVADHVVPWSVGGTTSMDNLVSACAACNYGKDGYSIEQIGIENPLERVSIVDEWDGLTAEAKLIL